MMKNLNKSMTDMQLTKQTQDNIDVAWAELAKAEIDPEKAAENKNKILEEMKNWWAAHGKADAEAALDEAINQHRMLDDASNTDSDTVDIGDIGSGPF